MVAGICGMVGFVTCIKYILYSAVGKQAGHAACVVCGFACNQVLSVVCMKVSVWRVSCTCIVH